MRGVRDAISNILDRTTLATGQESLRVNATIGETTEFSNDTNFNVQKSNRPLTKHLEEPLRRYF